MTSSSIYYVYAYIRSDGTPYYIGKGKGKRMYSTNHPGIFLPPKQRIVILESNLTEIGALSLERRYIRWFGRKNNKTVILKNKTDGGEGSTGMVVTQETREKQRRAKLYLKSITLYFLNCSKRIRLSDPLIEEFLSQGWLPYKTKDDVEYIKAVTNKKRSVALSGKKKVSYTKSEKQYQSAIKASQAAAKAKLGSKAYNNGVIEKRCKEHPGEGWVLGGLKRINTNRSLDSDTSAS
jgi:hypothetical protein